MQNALYDAVSYGMRYWFLLLIALMLFTLIAVSVSEYKRHKSVMNIVGQFIGFLEILGGDEDSIGMRIGLMKENLIGSGMRADIMIEDEDVLRSHAIIRQKGDGVILSLVVGASCKINGRLATKPHRIFSGDVLTFGSVLAMVHLKEGENDA